MKTFLKAQFSALIATGVDFLVMICLVEILEWHYTLAVFVGAIGGALTNFLVNRYWAFDLIEQPVKQQSLKYSLVWMGSVLLNVSGVYLMTQVFKVSYIFSKIMVAIIVGLSFNYLLQKNFVFVK
ncbi:GtrA family protein [Sphingobacteriaceae bacterium]|nr:GtrA family protein [Sphingobacteriaceae bacterium]